MTVDKKALQPLLWSVVAAWRADDQDLQRHADALDVFLGETTVEEVALGLLDEINQLNARVRAAEKQLQEVEA
ncbi:hypothetical protein QSV36_10265 [Pseudomonas sp. BCRC 81390]|uniref:hypothetical protein n=1 Tax=Pseudomonas sp. BCRC 81390 TaxID=3054778 RepID=UPI002599B01B|nr:hypothetical protein [Pseudomonas sp. BCRC 81390]MDM3885981.1 hypothetical protein [Pseudomonas sp. BCRC 81390]